VAKGNPARYKGCLDCYRQTYVEGGIPNLWTGWGPNVMRNSIVNAAEIATYDQIKQMILQSGLLKDGTPCHMASASLAGLCAVCVGSPVDVMKTKMMNAQPGEYKSPIDCFTKTLRANGPLGFYAGFIPNFARLAGWNVVMFLTLERVKASMS